MTAYTVAQSRPDGSARRQNNCHRCGVLLARAPAAGRGDICGWCEMEKPQ